MKGILIILLSLVYSVHAEWKPQVSAEESEKLNRLMVLSSTNAPAARIELAAMDRSVASPVFELLLGNLQLQNASYGEAAKHFQRVIERAPEYADAHAQLARTAMLQEDPAGALVAIRRLLSLGRRDAETLTLMGHAFLSQANFVGADRVFRDVLVLRDDPNARLGLIKALLGLERYSESRTLIEDQLKIQPEAIELWRLRAHLLVTEGKSEQAVHCLETARRLGKTDGGMLATLGDLYINRDQAEEAVAVYHEAFLVERPSTERLLQAVRGLLMVDRWKEAAELLNEMPPQPELNEEASLLKAAIAEMSGNGPEAEAQYRSLVSINPLNGEALLKLGQLLSNRNALEEAVMACERASRVDGFKAKARIQQALVEVKRSRYRRAVELLEVAQQVEEQAHVARYLDQLKRLIRD